MTTQELTFAGLVAALFRPDEHLSLSEKLPGGQFKTLDRRTAAEAVAWAVPQDRCVWYSINPIAPGAKGRGTAGDVTRWAALWADLDLARPGKPGGLPDDDAAGKVAADLSMMLGAEPTSWCFSGHGFQPVWAIDREDPEAHLDSEEKRVCTKELLRRWGDLVAQVCTAHGGHGTDPVFDLARVLRVPGSVNWKHPDEPVGVGGVLRQAQPLTVAEIRAVLDLHEPVRPAPAPAPVTAPVTLLGPVTGGHDRYVEATLRNARDRVAAMPPGGRNKGLNAEAYTLGRKVGAGVLDRADVEAVLLDGARANGVLADDGEQQVSWTIASGIDAGVKKPLDRAEPTEPSRLPTGAVAHVGGPYGGGVSQGEGGHETATAPLDAGLDAVRHRFPPLDLAALVAADRPPREWVVVGLLPAGASVSLAAPAGTGKSLLVLALAVAIALGKSLFAGLVIPRPRRVLYVDLENTGDDLAERLADLGVTPENAARLAERLVLLHLPPLAALDSAAGGAELQAILDAYDIRRGDLVVLDSFQRVTVGEENSSDTVRAYYRSTGLALKARGVTVIRLDNTGKDVERGSRGSSGKRDDVDVELVATRDADNSDVLVVKPGKVRIPDIRALRVRQVVDDAGRLTFDTDQDPYRRAIADVIAAMDRLDLPVDAGLNRTFDALKQAGVKAPRGTVRQAVKERRAAARNVRNVYAVPGGTVQVTERAK